jgi:plastocyanin
MRLRGTAIATVGAVCLVLLGRAASAPSQDVPTSFSPQEGRVADAAVFDNGFAPTSMVVPAGTTVVWTNQGRNHHTVTSDQGVFDSGVLEYGTSYYFTSPIRAGHLCLSLQL